MADHAEYLRTKFTVAVHLDEEQKRQIEIRRLRNDAERKRLDEMRVQRGEALAALRAKQEQERKETVEREVRKRLQGSSDLRYEMPGGGRVSLRDRERSLRQSIDEQIREKQDIDFEEARAQWNARIDGELERAQVREQQPSRQQDFQENSRDITSAASSGTDADRTDEDRQPHETTLERIRRERIEAWERERQSDRDFDRER